MTVYRGRTNRFRFNRAKSMATTPERIDALLHQETLVNPAPPLSAGAIEARQNMEKAKQLKGNDMPDIHTALKTALENSKRAALTQTLNAWEEDDKQTQTEKPVATGKQNVFEVTSNVTRATFNYVRDNPNKTAAQIKTALKEYNSGSILSLLTQFVYQEQLTRDDQGRYKAIVAEYRPLMSRAKWDKDHGIEREETPAEKRAKRKIEKLKKAMKATKQNLADKGLPTVLAKGSGIGALPRKQKEEITSILISRGWTAQGVVDKLTVVQARQLYDLLKQIFGG